MRGSQYNSFTNTFYAPDMYNLTLPVVPPGNLTLLSSVFAPQFFYYRFGATTVTPGFQGNGPQHTDNPYLRNLGLWCNMGDCLTDIVANHGSANGLGLTLQLEHYAPKLTGTIANTAGNAAIVGTGTKFTTELAPLMTITWVDAGKVVRQGVILSITDDTNLTLFGVTPSTGMFSNNSIGAKVYPRVSLAGTSNDIPLPGLNALYPFGFFLGDVSKIRDFSGVVTVASGSTTVTGFGTKFTSEVTVGQPLQFINNAGTIFTRTVASVTSDTLLTLDVAAPSAVTRLALLNYSAWNAGGTPASNVPALFLKATMANDLKFSTILLESDFSTKPLQFNAVAEIEHNLGLIQTLDR